MNLRQIDLNGSRVLVTGAAGFIGTHLCRRLTSEGAQVHGTSRRHRQPQGNVQRWWQIDLTDMAATEKLINAVNPNFAFHLASHVFGSRELSAMLPAFQDNLITTVHLMTALAGGPNCRVVLAGSMEEPPKTEPDPVPSSPYAAAKMAANMYSRLFHQLYALPVTTAGISMVYGPGQHDLTKLVPYSILSMLRNQTLKLSGGTRLADWVYVEDVVDALITIARSEKSAAQTLDVGTGVQTSVRGVVEMLQTIIGGDTTLAFGAVAERPNVQQPKADTETTFEKIGWQARTPLCEGLENTVIWHRERLSEFDQISSARLTTGGQSRN